MSRPLHTLLQTQWWGHFPEIWLVSYFFLISNITSGYICRFLLWRIFCYWLNVEAPDGSADQSAVKENFKEFKCTSDTRRQAETHTHSIKQTDTVCVSYSGGSSSNRAAEGGGGQLCHRRSISSSSQHTKSRPLPPVLRRGSTRHHPGFG